MKVINLRIRQFENLKILTQILLSISVYGLPASNFRLFFAVFLSRKMSKSACAKRIRCQFCQISGLQVCGTAIE
jgi:hypothetical protein